MARWRELAAEYIVRHGLDSHWNEVLSAFEGPEPVVSPAPDDLPARILELLSQEVDGDQAALFERRFTQMRSLLRQLDAPEARALELFLLHRAASLLAAPPPRALRIRALVDYVFGHTSVLVHRDPHAPDAATLVRETPLVWRAPGIAHAKVVGRSREGPVHINVLRLQDVALRAVVTRPSPERTGNLLALVRESGAQAAFSGGYFLYSEPDIALPSVRGDPVGLLVSGGETLSAPVFRRAALVQRASGRISIETLGPAQATWTLRGQPLQPLAVNDASAGPVAAFNRAFGARSPSRPEQACAVVAGRVTAVGSGGLDIPLAGVVLLLPSTLAVQVGDAVSVQLHREPCEEPCEEPREEIREAMGGGPMLSRTQPPNLASEDFAETAPPITFSRDETHDHNLLPRLGVGMDDSGVLWVVAVDGRDLVRAPGLTLRGTWALLRALGCTEAMNLDGGSSKRMVVGDEVVDLPSTEIAAGGGQERVRPVRSAVLVASALQR